jgi:hypothetical protein
VRGLPRLAGAHGMELIIAFANAAVLLRSQNATVCVRAISETFLCKILGFLGADKRFITD